MADSSASTIWPTVLFELALGGLGIGVAYAAGFWKPADWLHVGVPYHTESLLDAARAIGRGVVATVPMFAILGLVNLIPFSGFKELNELVDDTLVPMFSDHSILMLLAASLSAGIGEEILFRWTIQTGFAEGLDFPGAWACGVAIGAAVFGLMHWLTPTYAVLATLIGAYLGLELLWTESLVAVVTTHALYDFVVLLYVTRWLPCKKQTSKASAGSSEVSS